MFKKRKKKKNNTSWDKDQSNIPSHKAPKLKAKKFMANWDMIDSDKKEMKGKIKAFNALPSGSVKNPLTRGSIITTQYRKSKRITRNTPRFPDTDYPTED